MSPNKIVKESAKAVQRVAPEEAKPKAEKVKAPKEIGCVLSPTTSSDLSIKLFTDRVNEGDFIQIPDEGKDSKVIARLYGLKNEAVVNEEGDTEAIAIYGKAEVLGRQYPDRQDRLELVRFPVYPNTNVFKMSEVSVAQMMRLDKGDLFIGTLEGSGVPVKLMSNRVFEQHGIVTGRTGSGKSYGTGVMCEELAKAGYTVVVIDPHSQYSFDKPNLAETQRLSIYGLKPTKFVQNKLTIWDGIPSTRAVGYNRPFAYTRNDDDGMELFVTCYRQIAPEEAKNRGGHETTVPSKEVGVLNVNLAKSMDVKGETHVFYVDEPETPLEATIEKGKINIMGLSGLEPDEQKAVVTMWLTKLFLERKRLKEQGIKLDKMAIVIEEAHIFCPQEQEIIGSRKAIETLVKEARKFSMPVILVTQRPQGLSTTVRANVGNTFIFRTTGISDRGAVIGMAEGVDGSYDPVVKNLPQGQCLIAGTVVDFPIVIQVRMRQSEHTE